MGKTVVTFKARSFILGGTKFETTLPHYTSQTNSIRDNLIAAYNLGEPTEFTATSSPSGQ